jgi:hypothetical protein
VLPEKSPMVELIWAIDIRMIKNPITEGGLLLGACCTCGFLRHFVPSYPKYAPSQPEYAKKPVSDTVFPRAPEFFCL